MGSKMNGPGLYEFLIEAELQQYYNTLKNELKVQNTAQLKYVTDEDLLQVGMSRPEIRRLKKYYLRHFPNNVLAKMKKKLLSKTDNPISSVSLSGGGSSLGKYSRSVAPGRHIIQADSIQIFNSIGNGEFAIVKQGVWTNHDGQRIQVAIKCLSQERMENNPVEFLKEAAIMHSVDHEHIVRLYGVVLDTAALMLVTELAPLRSLLECLKEPSMRPNLTIPTLYDFSVQICAGMEYLEGKRLIHRDLAARNILVFSRTKVKISDFGLSRALGVGKDYYQTNFNVNLKLPIAWCAPESINYLKFTSSSDVFGYGVVLWEMYSYGFQPWAGLTGQQILEAIDEPNYQRLEKPDCCPHDIYYQIMLKCWQHDPENRPTFADLATRFLPECKPEQVQAIRDSEKRGRRDYLEYEAGDLITVLEKNPNLGSAEDTTGLLWKGILKDGRCGLFYPANSIAYLGSSFPTVKKCPFTRNDTRSSSLRKGRLSVDMISGPQGDFKHTGHVGPDGQIFGDIAFLGSKAWVPRQVVPPYKPEMTDSLSMDFATPIARLPACTTSKTMPEIGGDLASSDTAPLLSTAAQMNMDENGHEYHEISDEENDLIRIRHDRSRSELGLSNPALSSKSQSPLDSPRLENAFDLDGPSLIDEVFGALEHADEVHNVKNELRELTRTKKKFATVKPISSSDRKTLDHAIHLANELASRSMFDLDKPGKLGGGNSSLDDVSSPRTPNSPNNHKKKFNFMLGGGRAERERRNYSQEAASIPDIQSTLTEEAKEAYNSLVEKPSLGSLGFLTPSFENKSTSFNFPDKSSNLCKHSEFFEPESPLKSSNNDCFDGSGFPSTSSALVKKTKLRNLSLPDENMVMDFDRQTFDQDDEVDGNPLRLLRQNKGGANILPLPPRDRQKGFGGGTSQLFPRHQRKHPLLVPSKIQMPSSSTNGPPPPPPPKPVRQHFRTHSASADVGYEVQAEAKAEPVLDKSNGTSDYQRSSDLAAVIESLRLNRSVPTSNDNEVKLYENFFCDTDNNDSTPAAAECNINSNNAVPVPAARTRDSAPKSSVKNNADTEDATNSGVSALNLTSKITPSPSMAETQPTLDLLKVRTVRRILGNSATDEECRWAVQATNDAAHAVKMLRLRSLLPESLFCDSDNIISALEMCNWDVARTATFLLDQEKSKAKLHENRRKYSRTDAFQSVCESDVTRNDNFNNNFSNTERDASESESRHTNANQDRFYPTRI